MTGIHSRPSPDVNGGRDSTFHIPPQSSGTASATKKRKAEDGLPGHHDKKLIVLRPYTSPVYERPTSLRFLHTLERSKLPLCYLDHSTTPTLLPQSSFYSTRIVELETRNEDDVPLVAIARLTADKSLYALERVDTGTYAVCRLAHWVRVKDLRGCHAGKLPGRVPLSAASGNRGHEKCGIPEAQQTVKSTQPARKDCRNNNLGHTSIPSETSAGENPTDVSITAAEPQDSRIEPNPKNAAQDVRVSARQVYEKLVCQYMETLYLSKTSLAFFAKGPLARARAAFVGPGSLLEMSDLACFLRSLCISSRTLDKKSKTKVTDLVVDLSKLVPSDEDDAAATQPRKIGKRLHPTKAGMFPHEEDYIRQWWCGHAALAGVHAQSGMHMAKCISNLHARETFLQVILTLETMATEAISTSKTLPTAFVKQGECAGTNHAQPSIETTITNVTAVPKKQNLETALDLLVDRLCIWQSIEQEGSLSSVLSARVNSREASAKSATAVEASNDVLRDFFSEVILPFYASRLPQQVALLAKKLGGTSGPSPHKLSASRPQPGAAIIRRAPPSESTTEVAKRSRTGLQRAPTDSAIRVPSWAPSLLRFASDSAAMASVKRERSETPALSTIPLADPIGRHSRSGSLANFKHLSKRQVDLTALSASNEAKQRRKAAVEAQLQSAISVLKKPNRVAAVRENADLTDLRTLDRTTAQRPFQVMATPKRVNKFTEPPVDSGDTVQDACTPPRLIGICTHNAMVPSSAVRPTVPAFPRSYGTSTSSLVQATPMRGSARLASDHVFVHDEIITRRPGKLFSKRITPRASSESPVAVRAAQPASGSSATGDLTAGSANRKLWSNPDDGCAGVGMPGTIYDELGWNNEPDDLA